MRTLYGNHDAWPGTLPALGAGLIEQQQRQLACEPGWDTADWLSSPLEVPIPGRSAHVDLFALDTVCWDPFRNTMAVGRIDQNAAHRLIGILRGHRTLKREGFRILATHHPFAFPWLRNETRAVGIAPAMRLLNDKAQMRWLRNEDNDPQGLGPLVHLILSGHTHMLHPAGLPSDVEDVKQGLLAPWQLQLVGGPLMLNKSTQAARETAALATVASRDEASRFAPATVDHVTCQAQVLQFWAAPEDDGSLFLLRYRVQSQDGGATYGAQPPELTRLYYRTP